MSASTAKTPRNHSIQVAVLMAEGNLEEALGHARVLLSEPDPSAQVSEWKVECERLLTARYMARVGGPRALLEVRSTPAEQARLPLSPAAAFLLTLVDGYTTVDEILDISGFGRLEALRDLARLVESGAVVILA